MVVPPVMSGKDGRQARGAAFHDSEESKGNVVVWVRQKSATERLDLIDGIIPNPRVQPAGEQL